MTNYLLKRIKDDSEDYLTSQNDILFQSFFSTIKDDLLTHKKIFTHDMLHQFSANPSLVILYTISPSSVSVAMFKSLFALSSAVILCIVYMSF
jgi:hypothetical protein